MARPQASAGYPNSFDKLTPLVPMRTLTYAIALGVESGGGGGWRGRVPSSIDVARIFRDGCMRLRGPVVWSLRGSHGRVQQGPLTIDLGPILLHRGPLLGNAQIGPKTGHRRIFI